jgi:hypothetical protein
MPENLLLPSTKLTSKAKLKNMFYRFHKMISNNEPIAKTDGFSKLKEFPSQFRNWQPFGEKGPSVGNLSVGINAGVHGVKALGGLYENSKNEADYEDLRRKILAAKISNPMYDAYLDPDQENLLRKVSNGSKTSGNFGNIMSGVVEGIPNALLSAGIGAITGGGPAGAIVGGLGSLINSGISGYGQGQQASISELQALYDSLRQAQADYKSMKRPANLMNAGLQTRYFNQLY